MTPKPFDWNAKGQFDPTQLGERLEFTLAEAYFMARRGKVFSTIDPAEFATMSQAERRDHRRKLKRLARNAASNPLTPEEEAAEAKYRAERGFLPLTGR